MTERNHLPALIALVLTVFALAACDPFRERRGPAEAIGEAIDDVTGEPRYRYGDRDRYDDDDDDDDYYSRRDRGYYRGRRGWYADDWD